MRRASLGGAIVIMLVGGLLAAAGTPEPETPMSKDSRTVKIAVCQTLCLDSDKEGNFRRIEHALEAAAGTGAKIACFPETALLGWVNPDAYKLADPIPGPSTERLGALARKHKLMIAIGLAEKEGDKLYDSAVLIDEDGKILLKHRKINTLTELLDPPYVRGTTDQKSVADTPVGRIGMLICADTFDPAILSAARELEPDLMLVPYGWAADVDAWPEHGKNLAATVSKAAKQIGCAVVGTDLVGMITHGPWTGKTYGGQSVAARANGQVIDVLKDRDVDLRILEVPVGRPEGG